MQNPKFRIKAILSALIAAAMASQTAAAAFADASFGSSDYGEFRLITPVYGEPSVYGEQDIRFVDENGDEVNFNLIPEENDRISNDGALPTSYNLNTLGLVTPVKDQADTGTCWAHSALAAAESSLIKDGMATKSTDFSEAHLVWFTQGQNTAPSDPLYGDPLSLGIGTPSKDYEDGCYNQGGNIYWSIGALASWIGTANESSYPNVTTRPSIAESKRYDSTYHLQKSVIFDPSDRASIKSYLMENGALTLSYYSGNYYYTDGSYVSFYQNATDSTNHAVTLVGWDDNFSANNFKITPPGDGAWLIKNSWGTDWGYMGGYFYLSYYDTSISNIASMELEKTTNYGKVYQHNLQAMPGISAKGTSITGANEFTATGSDPLTAVSFGTSDASVPYTISIYKGCTSKNPMSGTLVHKQTGTAAYAGYHTVKLSSEVSIPAGTRFSVCVALNKADTPFWMDINAKSTGDSFLAPGIATSSSSWTDTASQWNRNVAIKAFTKGAGAITAPTGVKATAGDGQVTVSWNAVSGATKYAVYSYLNGKYTSAGQTTGTTLTVKNLTNGTKYGFLVIAYVNGAWTPYTTADLVYATPVAKPKFTATAGNGQVTLKWSAVTGATKYAAYYYLNGKYTSAGQTTGTSLTVKGLTNGTKYGFLVIAYVNGTWTPYTTADLVYATPVASSKPKFTATAGDGQVTLKWSAVTGATKYAAYYYLNGKYTSAGQTTGTSLTVKNLTNGTKYGFLVIAYVNGAWTPYTTADLVYATPVAKPKVTATAGNGQVTLKWNAVTGATKYAAYYYLNGKYTSAGQTTGTTMTVKNLTNGTKYGFLVIAYVNGAWTPYTTADLVYATPVASSSKPKVTATAGDGQVTLKWNAVSGATKYATYSYLNGKYTSAGQTTGTTMTVKNLTNGTKYGFLVIAYVNGAWTPYTTADLVYATPVAKPKVTATAGNGQVTLKWSAVSGATKYATYYYINGKYTAAGQTTGTTLTVKNLTNGTRYGFLVIAYVNGAWTSYTTADLVYATPM